MTGLFISLKRFSNGMNRSPEGWIKTAALAFSKDVGEGFIERFDVDRVKDISHLRIARDLVDLENILQ